MYLYIIRYIPCGHSPGTNGTGAVKNDTTVYNRKMSKNDRQADRVTAPLEASAPKTGVKIMGPADYYREAIPQNTLP